MLSNRNSQLGPVVVGFTYNIEKAPDSGEEKDKYAEFDSEDTINHIISALESTGHKVIPIEANKDLLSKLLQHNVDIIFNIAEGTQNSEGREAIFPGIFEFLNIPYVGSDPLTLALGLDKPSAKKIWMESGVLTAKFKILTKLEEIEGLDLNYPLIVKPAHEGTSKGIFNDSYVENIDQLKNIVKKRLEQYSQPLIVEEFIDGREFTVTVIGNSEPYEILPPVEISFDTIPKEARAFCSYEVKTIWDDPNSTVCPAKITKNQEKKLKEMALRAYKAIGCRDFGRVDLRLNKNDDPYILEINPLPGMSYSPEVNHSMIKAAKAAGYEYNKYIIRLLNEGIKRCGKKKE
ncbi:MAG: ATP-grasp domain-containing protein [Candidatus Lokiarchaeota archaeon]|nr:ATP-grasp domain-containing protein [Candidatus Lokiarchaeota archaeon]